MYMNMSFSETLGLEHVPQPNRFSHLLRDRRERLGLTCQEMSVCAGLGVDTWSALESCEILDPTWEMLHRVAAAIDVDAGSLLIIAILSQGARRLGLR